MGRFSEALRSDEGGVRWYVWVAHVAAVLIVLFVAVQNVDDHMLLGKVEAMNGNAATVSVAELNKTFVAESTNPNLKPGTQVIVQVQGETATLEATSPGMVNLILRLKALVP